MNGRMSFVMIAVAACLSGLGAFSAAANDADRTGERGGYVLPGNTDGVNPVFHSEYFRNSKQSFLCGALQNLRLGDRNLSRLRWPPPSVQILRSPGKAAGNRRTLWRPPPRIDAREQFLIEAEIGHDRAHGTVPHICGGSSFMNSAT